jgi:hypothetical protein
MQIEINRAEEMLRAVLDRSAFPAPSFAAKACIWLEACAYPGLQTLVEALRDPTIAFSPLRSGLGLDLQQISCAQIGEAVVDDILKNGRADLRNVRHGLFLLPASIEHNIGIGCPIDAGFALGGERTKNPYTEQIAMAEAQGINIDDVTWNKVMEHHL